MVGKREMELTKQSTYWRRHGWVKWAAGGLLLALLATAVGLQIVLRRVEPFLRARIVEALENRFHARVELDGFHISLVNKSWGLWAEGKGLRIWPPAQVSNVIVPESQDKPLIRLEEFRFHTPLRYRPGVPIAISLVELKGLRVDLPPKPHPADGNGSSGALDPTQAAKSNTPRGWGTQQDAAPSTSLRSTQDDKREWNSKLVSFDVERIECTGAELVIETDKPGKLPQEFAIARLSLMGISKGGPIGFDAELMIPRPKGNVKTTGSFAWTTGDLGAMLLQGDYRLEHADLASFKDIAGTLDSTGHFQGTLRDLTVDGETRTPDFRLTHFDSPLGLTTRFHARVDATNGNTWLEPVEATLEHSHFTAQGSIVRVPEMDLNGIPLGVGHEIELTVDIDHGRIEDFQRLMSHTNKVLLTGDMALKTSLFIPHGSAPVHERMKLDGWFSLENAVFATDKLQRLIAELSLRGQGHPERLKIIVPSSILSQMKGSFQVEDGEIVLPALSFAVPGATIQLKGNYQLEWGALNFDGVAKMEAPVSMMVGGWKGMLLKPADRLLRKDGVGTEIPLQITGTREKPEFTVEVDRLKISRGR